MRYVAQLCVKMRYAALKCVMLRNYALKCVTLRYGALKCILLRNCTTTSYAVLCMQIQFMVHLNLLFIEGGEISCYFNQKQYYLKLL